MPSDGKGHWPFISSPLSSERSSRLLLGLLGIVRLRGVLALLLLRLLTMELLRGLIQRLLGCGAHGLWADSALLGVLLRIRLLLLLRVARGRVLALGILLLLGGRVRVHRVRAGGGRVLARGLLLLGHGGDGGDGLGLGLHLVVARLGRALAVSEDRLEATLLAGAEEGDEGPDEGGDEQEPGKDKESQRGLVGQWIAQVGYSPVQGAEAGNGGHHVPARLPEDDVASLADGAGLAVDETAVVEARVHIDGDDISGTLGGDGGKGREPEDDEETVQDEDGDDVVAGVEGGDLLREDDVADDDPGEQALSTTSQRSGSGRERTSGISLVRLQVPGRSRQGRPDGSEHLRARG